MLGRYSFESARLASHHLEFDVRSAQPSLVSMAQSFYHPWHAYVDGQRVPLWRANYAFQALEVPAGQHHVNVKYEDRAFQVGAVISAVTWIAVLLAWLRRGRLPRTSGPALAFNETTVSTPKANGSSAPSASQ